MTYHCLLHFLRRCAALLVGCACGFALLPSPARAQAVPSAKPDGRTKSFSVPGGDAATTLKQFIEQSGEQIVYVVSSVRGVQTKAVSGQLVPRDALEQMLAGTPLVAVKDSSSTALTVRRQGHDKKSADGDPKTSTKAKVEDGVVRLEKMEVTGTRIGSVEGGGFAPVFSFTRSEIERTGQTTIEGVLSRITQGNTSVTAGDRPSFGDAIARQTGVPDVFSGVNWMQAGISAVSLRGFDANETLVLVNGRRLPFSPTSPSSAPFVNVSGIPLSAIERIDVLPSSASALYGAEASSGVINIILRDHYAGGELTYSYGNTTSTDAAEQKVAGSIVLNRGKTRVMLSFSAFFRNAQLNRDRWFTTGIVNSAEEFARGLGTLGASPGNVRSVPVGGRLPNLPGLNSTIAAIPAGQNGVGLTIANFVDGAGKINAFTPLLDFNAVVPPTERYSVNLNAGHKFGPALELFLETGYSANRNLTTYNSYQRAVSVPAANPFNPFGVAVEVYWADPATPKIATTTWNETLRLLSGVRGQFRDGWDYEIAALQSRADSASTHRNSPNPLLLNPPALTGPTAFNPFADLRAFPDANSPARMGQQLYYTQYFDGRSDQVTYDGRLRGRLFEVPAGNVTAVVGGERREDSYRSARTNVPTGVSRTDVSRRISSAFGEVVTPLLGRDTQFPLLRALEVQTAGRYETFSDFNQASKTYQLAVRWQPLKSLALRANYGTGFVPPPVTLLGGTQTFSFSTTFTDPLRNNEVYTVPSADVLYGGNKDLRPSTSKSLGVGGTFSPGRLKGLSIAVDFSRIHNSDRFLGQPPSVQNSRGSILEFPERFTRAPATPAEVAAGIPGRIIKADLTAINDGNYWTEALDLDLQYRHGTSFADLVFRAEGTHLLLARRQANSTVRYVNRRGVNGQPIWRGSLSAFAESKIWTAGLTLRYIGEYFFRIAQFTEVSETKEVDLYLSRKLEWQNLTVSLAVSNLLDRDPPLRTDSATRNTNNPPYSTFTDPRLRFYTLTLRKEF